MAIDLIRKENRPEADTTDPYFDQAMPDDPFSVLEMERKSDRLRSFVEKLPSEQQQVLRLAFFEEKPHSEVANELKIPYEEWGPNEIKDNNHKAIAILRSFMFYSWVSKS